MEGVRKGENAALMASQSGQELALGQRVPLSHGSALGQCSNRAGQCFLSSPEHVLAASPLRRLQYTTTQRPSSLSGKERNRASIGEGKAWPWKRMWWGKGNLCPPTAQPGLWEVSQGTSHDASHPIIRYARRRLPGWSHFRATWTWQELGRARLLFHLLLPPPPRRALRFPQLTQSISSPVLGEMMAGEPWLVMLSSDKLPSIGVGLTGQHLPCWLGMA